MGTSECLKALVASKAAERGVLLSAIVANADAGRVFDAAVLAQNSIQALPSFLFQLAGLACKNRVRNE